MRRWLLLWGFVCLGGIELFLLLDAGRRNMTGWCPWFPDDVVEGRAIFCLDPWSVAAIPALWCFLIAFGLTLAIHVVVRLRRRTQEEGR